jgi:hypothetical protein
MGAMYRDSASGAMAGPSTGDLVAEAGSRDVSRGPVVVGGPEVWYERPAGPPGAEAHGVPDELRAG